MITIKELASILGISPTTVSNVVNGHTEKMSPATRQRIEEALVQYQFHRTIRQEDHSKALKLISVDFYLRSKENVIMDPFCSELLNAICVKLKEFGAYPVCGIPQKQEDIFHKLQARNIQGGIVVGVDPWECQNFSAKVGKPVVFIDCGEGEYDNVGIADYEGGKEMTEFILNRDIAKLPFSAIAKIQFPVRLSVFEGIVMHWKVME